jgi:hypothetical protein
LSFPQYLKDFRIDAGRLKEWQEIIVVTPKSIRSSKIDILLKN